MRTVTMPGRARLAACWLAVAHALAITAVQARVVSFDHYGGAYGVSVGTDTHYCSIETAWPPVTCESAS